MAPQIQQLESYDEIIEMEDKFPPASAPQEKTESFPTFDELIAEDDRRIEQTSRVNQAWSVDAVKAQETKAVESAKMSDELAAPIDVTLKNYDRLTADPMDVRAELFDQYKKEPIGPTLESMGLKDLPEGFVAEDQPRDILGTDPLEVRPDDAFAKLYWKNLKAQFVGDNKPYESTERMAVVDRAFNAFVGQPLRVGLKAVRGMTFGAPDIMWAALKRALPEDQWAEYKDMNLDEAMDHAAGYNPSAFNKAVGDIAHFMGAISTASSIIGAPAAKTGVLGKAAHSALQFGAAGTATELSKLAAEKIDPTEADYGYEGPKAVIADMALGFILSVGHSGAKALWEKALIPIEKETVLLNLGLEKGASYAEIEKAARLFAKERGRSAAIQNQFAEAIKQRTRLLRGEQPKDIIFRSAKTKVSPPKQLLSDFGQDIAKQVHVDAVAISRTQLVNRHIALYQRYQREPIKEVADKIMETRGHINALDRVTDPIDGRPFVPPELEALDLKRRGLDVPAPDPQVFGEQLRVGTPPGEPIALQAKELELKFREFKERKRYDDLLAKVEQGDNRALGQLSALVQGSHLPTYDTLLEKAMAGDEQAVQDIIEGRYFIGAYPKEPAVVPPPYEPPTPLPIREIPLIDKPVTIGKVDTKPPATVIDKPKTLSPQQKRQASAKKAAEIRKAEIKRKAEQVGLSPKQYTTEVKALKADVEESPMVQLEREQSKPQKVETGLYYVDPKNWGEVQAEIGEKFQKGFKGALANQFTNKKGEGIPWDTYASSVGFEGDVGDFIKAVDDSLAKGDQAVFNASKKDPYTQALTAKAEMRDLGFTNEEIDAGLRIIEEDYNIDLRDLFYDTHNSKALTLQPEQTEENGPVWDGKSDFLEGLYEEGSTEAGLFGQKEIKPAITGKQGDLGVGKGKVFSEDIPIKPALASRVANELNKPKASRPKTAKDLAFELSGEKTLFNNPANIIPEVDTAWRQATEGRSLFGGRSGGFVDLTPVRKVGEMAQKSAGAIEKLTTRFTGLESAMRETLIAVEEEARAIPEKMAKEGFKGLGHLSNDVSEDFLLALEKGQALTGFEKEADFYRAGRAQSQKWLREAGKNVNWPQSTIDALRESLTEAEGADAIQIQARIDKLEGLQYVRRIYEQPKDIKSRAGRAVKRFTTKSSLLKQRKFDTLEDAVKAGFVPRHAAVSYANLMSEAHRVKLHDDLIRSINENPKLSQPEKVGPPDWVKIDPRLMEATAGNVYHPAIADAIEELLWTSDKHALTKAYDYVNNNIKQLSFYNPFVMGKNDLAQAWQAAGFSSAARFPEAVKEVATKGAKYQKLRKMGIFNNVVSLIPSAEALTQSMLDEIQKSWGRRAAEHAAKWLIPTNIVNDVRAINDATTWKMDEVLRTMVALELLEGSLLSRAANKLSLGFLPKSFKDRNKLSDFETVELANDFMANYGKVPKHTRQVANRMFFTPTYRTSMLRLIGKMFTKPRIFWPQILRHTAYKLFLQYIAPGLTAAWLLGRDWDKGKFEKGYRIAVDVGGGKERVFSLSDPLLEINKLTNRPFLRSLEYNLSANAAAIIRIVSGPTFFEKMDRKKYRNAPEILQKMNKYSGLFKLGTPVVRDILQWYDEDKTTAEKFMTQFAIAYVYSRKRTKKDDETATVATLKALGMYVDWKDQKEDLDRRFGTGKKKRGVPLKK